MLLTKQDEKAATSRTASIPADRASEAPTKSVPNGLATISVSSSPDGADIYADLVRWQRPRHVETQRWEAHYQSYDGRLQGLVARNHCTGWIGSPFDSLVRQTELTLHSTS